MSLFTNTRQATREQVNTALMQVIDPEVGINIVDLGLVYDISVTGNRIMVALTLTTPACPMGNQLISDARQVLQASFETASLDIRLVWEPRWQSSMMTDKARQILGWR